MACPCIPLAPAPVLVLTPAGAGGCGAGAPTGVLHAPHTSARADASASAPMEASSCTCRHATRCQHPAGGAQGGGGQRTFAGAGSGAWRRAAFLVRTPSGPRKRWSSDLPSWDASSVLSTAWARSLCPQHARCAAARKDSGAGAAMTTVLTRMTSARPMISATFVMTGRLSAPRGRLLSAFPRGCRERMASESELLRPSQRSRASGLHSAPRSRLSALAAEAGRGAPLHGRAFAQACGAPQKMDLRAETDR
mmetsp:Transcript_65474/g.206924  ORF Transcript_65474/g.206924 Transcript_65474/m.206924 type:complete len:251 (-) Transcript_65474:761-1513(-)